MSRHRCREKGGHCAPEVRTDVRTGHVVEERSQDAREIDPYLLVGPVLRRVLPAVAQVCDFATNALPDRIERRWKGRAAGVPIGLHCEEVPSCRVSFTAWGIEEVDTLPRMNCEGVDVRVAARQMQEFVRGGIGRRQTGG